MTKAWDPVEEAKQLQTPEVGKVLFGTKYLVVRKLGRGGMGEVFEVVKPPQIMGVLKRMAPEMARLPKAKQLFLSEVQALAELDHPHIVRVHDFDTDGFGVPYMVMERLTGRTVGTLIDRRGKVEPEEAYEIVRQLLSALDCAHTHDTPVIHRDIKPDNVFLHQPKHGAPILKLIDFGLATGSGVQESEFAGSVHYAAPEQLYGQPVTPSTDLYAVGAVLYEMLSGKMPFDGPTPSEIGKMKSTRAPKPLTDIAPWVPIEVTHLVEKALAPRPSERHASAKEMRAALDRAVGFVAPKDGPAPRAVIPATTKVNQKVPLPTKAEAPNVAPPSSKKGGTAPLGRERPGFSADTLLHAGIPSKGPLAGLGREIGAGIGVGLVCLFALHLVLTAK